MRQVSKTVRDIPFPRDAQRDTHLTKMALDLLSAICQLLSWSRVQEAVSKQAI